MSGFYDTSSNFHPFECNGHGSCVHCDRLVGANHDPATCALCDPEYDGAPNHHRAVEPEASGATKNETDVRRPGGGINR